MADLTFVGRCFDVMLRARQHTYQEVLTKRPRRMAEFSAQFTEYFGRAEIPAYIWIGISVESADYCTDSTICGRSDAGRGLSALSRCWAPHH